MSSAYVQDLIERMLTLAAGKGHSQDDSRQMVGLAAVQLGIGKKIIIIDLTADGSLKEQRLQPIINPRIKLKSNEIVPGREGCWSCGNICGNVERSESVTLSGLDRKSNPIQFGLSGFVARIAQHEVDHLQGVRFPHRIPANHPERLHWVEPAEFDKYRLHWANWPILCPRERWDEMKAGNIA